MAVDSVAETANLYHVKHHCYESHPTVNPSGIVPLGPIINFAMLTRDSVDAARTR